MKKMEPLMKTMALDLISIDGLNGEEKQMLDALGGLERVLTDEERQQLASRMAKLLVPPKSINGQDLKTLTMMKSGMIGAMFALLTKDGKESASEVAALEVYRSVIVPEVSLDQCREYALNEMKTMQNKSKRAELTWNIRAIKTAQIAYDASFDTFVPADLYPPKGPGLKDWEASKSGGFNVIGWQPDGQVRGSYKVDVAGYDFTVTGIIDADGDGVYATYVATKSTNPMAPTTPLDVY